MLIYEKRTTENGNLKITLYGTLANSKSDSDQPIVFADIYGVELATRPTLSASYVSHLVDSGYDILRTNDNQEMIVGIKTGTNITWVIGSVVSTTNAQSEDEGISAQSEEDEEEQTTKKESAEDEPVVENESAAVAKGDLITMNVGNGDKQYRVLEIENNEARVVAMEPIDANAFEVASDNNAYDSSDLDELLTKWHVTLSDEARAAILIDYIYQNEYEFNEKSFNADTHASYADVLEQNKKSERLARYIYALDIDEIEDYFEGKYSTDDLKTLFWNDTEDHDADTSFWLRTASSTSSVAAYYMSGHGTILQGPIGVSFAIRPAFKVDLSKITYSKN